MPSYTILILWIAVACTPAARQGTSAAPTAPTSTVSAMPMAGAMADVKPDSSRHGYTAADVRFMQHMIGHHAQALAMTSLVAGRTGRDDMRLLAERIDVSQKTEISMMQRWLRERGEVVPNVGGGGMQHDMAGHDMAGHDMAPTSMPGMLTPAQMDALGNASGVEFDRLFLQGMIQHHEGAIVMVADLFATQGAGQEPETFRFASDVDTDQRAEIRRMRALLGQVPNDVLHR